MKSYRPANGTEGDEFQEKFCERCERHQEDENGFTTCELLMATFFLLPGEDGYPPEWVEDESGPRCTAFERRENVV